MTDNGHRPHDSMIDPNQTGPYQAGGPDEQFSSSPPARIDRYQIVRLLGQGGFGVVYLARDEQLARSVAVKVPHAHLVGKKIDVEAYFTEARTVAGLDHPNIVPVYDVGRTNEVPCFVVSKFIDGANLSARLATGGLTFTQAAALVATAADALHYAHTRAVVHRDVKPSNILLDREGVAYIVDFGVALRAEDIGKGPRYAGSPHYMSPEQARGEGHRVDGRSDIFSLGVVFYELLTGRRPFQAGSQDELLTQIAWSDPRPPRQINDRIPKELERIGLKALAKRAADRYTTARDLADDLRCFLAGPAAGRPEPAPVAQDPAAVAPTAAPASTLRPPPIVPKGLRAFDAADADFFLDLLPGPRDREGLPESIRFWKSRVETTELGAFTVGLLYGPSGCGKTSLVRAGLLPRLSRRVATVYVEAARGETEARLSRALSARFPRLLAGPLPESVMALRLGGGLLPGDKVLLVLDQFEQWLHAAPAEGAELVRALRQCDGDRVQCLVLVRDDFYLAVNRFFQELEVPIQEGRNYAFVDLFDTDHAGKLLTAFGRAYGRLPEAPGELSPAQAAFVERSVAGLAHDGKVIGLRLALFADMMKGRPWTAASLREVGGPEGVGVTFLEETFGSRTASPAHRVHQGATRAVLRALLPEATADIRGQVLPVETLRAVSGYEKRPAEFQALMAILEHEVRLIAPADDTAASPAGAAAPAQRYQLTHDFLVAAVREWLTRGERETPAGRARLLLAERARMWTAKPESRQLPTAVEWLAIVSRTRRARWSDAERRMMRAATRRQAAGLAFVLGVAVLLVVLVSGVRAVWLQQRREAQADALVDQLLVADLSRVPEIADQVAGLPGPWRERLAVAADDPARPPPERLRAHLLLTRNSAEGVHYLVGQLAEAPAPEAEAISQALTAQPTSAQELLWPQATDGTVPAGRRFRAAVALAALAPADPRWEQLAPPTAAELVRLHLLEAPGWARLLRPARRWLVPPLVGEYDAADAAEPVRAAAAAVLVDYAGDDPALLTRLLQDADASQFPVLFLGVARHPEACGQRFQQTIDAPAGDPPRRGTRRRANAAAALLLLHQPQPACALMSQVTDPDVRTELIDLLPAVADFDALWDCYERVPSEVGRQAVLLALDAARARDPLSPERRQRFEDRLAEIFATDPSTGVHSAAELALRRLGRADRIDAANGRLVGAVRPSWRVSKTGHTLAVVRGPVEFQIGSPGDEPQRDGGEDPAPRTIPYSYEIGTHEVTVAQFQRYFPDHKYANFQSPTPDCPMNYVTWFDVARYCRRLSEEEGVGPDDMIFPPVDEIRGDQPLVLPENWRQRGGYRWPTDAEWEYACRAGTTTRRFFGTADEPLARYGWWRTNAEERCWPVGSLRPNPLGLFDVLGNVGEWCLDRKQFHTEPPDPDEAAGRLSQMPNRVVRGGTFQQMSKDLRAAKRDSLPPDVGYSYTGFRIARTVPRTP